MLKKTTTYALKMMLLLVSTGFTVNYAKNAPAKNAKASHAFTEQHLVQILKDGIKDIFEGNKEIVEVLEEIRIHDNDAFDFLVEFFHFIKNELEQNPHFLDNQWKVNIAILRHFGTKIARYKNVLTKVDQVLNEYPLEKRKTMFFRALHKPEVIAIANHASKQIAKK